MEDIATAGARAPTFLARGIRLGDARAAALLIALLLPLYLATMYPDVLGSGDSAKFQYLGSVLGTAHPPGYPTYIRLTCLYSHLPLGTLAWRMNLFSGLCGLAALLCLCASARRLGAGAIQALVLTGCAGTGLVFWDECLAAEGTG